MKLSKLEIRHLLETGYTEEEIFDKQTELEDAENLKAMLIEKFSNVELTKILAELKDEKCFFINEELLIRFKKKQLLMLILLFREIQIHGKVKTYDFYMKYGFEKTEIAKVIKKIEEFSLQIELVKTNTSSITKKKTHWLSLKKTNQNDEQRKYKMIKFNNFNKIVLCLLLGGKEFVAFLKMLSTHHFDNDNFEFKNDNDFMNDGKNKINETKKSRFASVKKFTKISNTFIKLSRFCAWKLFKTLNSLTKLVVDLFKTKYDKALKKVKTNRYINLYSLFLLSRNVFVKQIL